MSKFRHFNNHYTKIRGGQHILLVGILLLGVVMTGCALQSVTEPQTFDPDLEPTAVPTTVAIAKPRYEVERGDVSRGLSLSGRVVPARETSLSFPASGEVGSIEVEFGQPIEAGDVLAYLDTSELLSEQQLAQSALTIVAARLAAEETQLQNSRRRAEIALERLQIRLDFAQAALNDDPSADAALAVQLLELDIELAELALSELDEGVDPTLQAEVDQAQFRLSEIEAMIANSQLVAPAPGTITRILVEPGQLVDDTEPAITMADLSELEVQSFARTEDMIEMSEGMPALASIAGRPGEIFPMTVARLPLPFGSGEDLEDGVLRLRFDSDEAFDTYESGDRLLIEMILVEQLDTLFLPTTAVRDFQGRYFVVLEDGETQRRVDVELGIKGENRYEILEGVTEGDTVIGP